MFEGKNNELLDSGWLRLTIAAVVFVFWAGVSVALVAAS